MYNHVDEIDIIHPDKIAIATYIHVHVHEQVLEYLYTVYRIFFQLSNSQFLDNEDSTLFQV